jgi:hypothetical protein
MFNNLSKSDFPLTSSCSKKLVYKKANYPTANDTNEYMKIWAQSGYALSKMEKMLFPHKIEIEENTQDCIVQTQTILQKENIILFEPAIVSEKNEVSYQLLRYC